MSLRLATWTTALIVALAATAACKPHSDAAQLKVTNGVFAAPNDYPAVVSINVATQKFICTGTFVGTNAVLTAAHCLDPQQVSGGPAIGLSVTTTGGQTITPTAAFFPAWAGEANQKPYADLAILALPQASAPAVMKIATTGPGIGAGFTIAGFGGLVDHVADISQTNPNIQQCVGTNQVLALADDFIYSIGESGTGNLSPAGQNAVGAPGDSGGPLIIGGDVAGIEAKGTGTLTLQQFAQGAGPMTDEEGRPVPLSASTLTGIQQAIQSGRQLAVDWHTNITMPAYIAWLQSFAALGIDVEFDGGAAPLSSLNPILGNPATVPSQGIAATQLGPVSAPIVGAVTQ